MQAAVGTSWRMGEICQGGGQWKYLYRALDKAGNPVDFLPPPSAIGPQHNNFLTRAIGNDALPTNVSRY